MLIALGWGASLLALAFGAVLGLRALFDPHWAARFVRLKPDGEGGFAEFRATYGGVFAAMHGAALALALLYLTGGADLVGVAASGAVFVLAAGWAGSCAGRLLSMWRDGTRSRFNLISAGVEAGMAVAIGAPWLAWFFSSPG